MNKLYAGIGSRTTPADVLECMKVIAIELAAKGFILRSGAADGADTAFEDGCQSVYGQSEIWLPWKLFNNHVDTGFYPNDNHYQYAEQLHPKWHKLTRGPRALHARNVGQILGHDINTPVKFVLCWTPDGAESEAEVTKFTGGTGTAIKCAARSDIPIFNLKNHTAIDDFMDFVLKSIIT